MDAITICLELNAVDAGLAGAALDAYYQGFLKQLLSYLYSHPRCALAMALTGEQLEFLSRSHPEAVELLGELAGRQQVELLGGGFYAPVMPLLFREDRSGQIEKMNALLRSATGRRPRGMALYGCIWEPSLVATLQTCGMEYVPLDCALIPPDCRRYLPLVTGEQGKMLKVLPVDSSLLPGEGEDAAAWLERLAAAVDAVPAPDGAERILVLSFTPRQMERFWQPSFLAVLEEGRAGIAFSLPQLYLKKARRFLPAYIPAGMAPQAAGWARTAYVRSQPGTQFPPTIYDFLNTYPQAHRLYERMLYISMALSQSHGGDKMRKKAAQERLWEAQRGQHLVDMPEGLPAGMGDMQRAYRALGEAEQLLRGSRDFRETLTAFDYNGDGLNEYVCTTERYHAVISLQGGQVAELDVIGPGVNYAASPSRLRSLDGVEDGYARGIFVEHLVEEVGTEELLAGSGTFARAQFAERKFDGRRKEIQLEGRGTFSALDIPVSLRKNYIITSNGFVVQYILKNENPFFPLRGVFVAEANFPLTHGPLLGAQYVAELIVDGERRGVPGSGCTVEGGVSLLQVTDTAGKTAFIFEPNEEAGFRCRAVEFRRPGTADPPRALSAQFLWQVDLAANRAMEKTINVGIVPARKNSGRSPGAGSFSAFSSACEVSLQPS